jgi:phosphoribosyl 1,2-cyclic phosphodiesterase
MTWRVRFWGTRGSIPAPGADTVRYGGNTSCVELRTGDRILICDSGTGIRLLGLSLLKEFGQRPIQADVFIGHTHWDHIQGFPFFLPAYSPRNSFRVHSAHGLGAGFEQVFRGQMNQSYFPVETQDMAAKMEFVSVNGPFDCSGIQVKTTFSNHPGVNIVYRFEKDGRSVTYLTDHENYQAQVDGQAGDFARKQDRLIEDFCRGTDLLICDSQYTDQEYPTRRGWGHSRWRDTLALGMIAEVKRLVLFHHEPTRPDAELDVIQEDCRRILRESNSKMDCLVAREGLEIEV